MIRPILFAAPGVRAILEGRKTQTRRPMKIQPQPIPKGLPVPGIIYTSGWFEDGPVPDYVLKVCPFGVPGDYLWVRETWCQVDPCDGGHVMYRSDATLRSESDRQEMGYVWRPSIHMPRWASRITLEIAGVRVERLQEITEEDAIAEGWLPWQNDPPGYGGPFDWFSNLWDSLNSDGWHTNPWVWVITFRRMEV